jgi:hypothetical protein
MLQNQFANKQAMTHDPLLLALYPITVAKCKGKIKWSLIQELVAAMVHICSKK